MLLLFRLTGKVQDIKSEIRIPSHWSFSFPSSPTTQACKNFFTTAETTGMRTPACTHSLWLPWQISTDVMASAIVHISWYHSGHETFRSQDAGQSVFLQFLCLYRPDFHLHSAIFSSTPWTLWVPGSWHHTQQDLWQDRSYKWGHVFRFPGAECGPLSDPLFFLSVNCSVKQISRELMSLHSKAENSERVEALKDFLRFNQTKSF